MKLELVVKLGLTLEAAATKAALLEIGFLLGARLIDIRITTTVRNSHALR